MADLEKHALKRDKSFVVRLVLVLCVGWMGGAVVYARLTQMEVGACAAKLFSLPDASTPDASAKP